ncbi:hypothetical protein M9435_006108 [Picochlorum sp. BPE23]|nr:hypothetical protein M9435_006108 [Picochlorum sp. BPE23]
MAERKVLNKYFPPDFDPSKVPKAKTIRSGDKQMKVRMMLPMSVRCNTCGNFMYKGTKFNTRMENVKGEDYLGIRLYRFYYKCTNCSAEFCMKTDPKSTDYIVEAGATRNYEAWRDKEEAAERVKAKREEEEKGDAMKALENRTLDSKREMDIMTALDEMKSLKSRHANIDHDTALAALKKAARDEGKTLEQELDEEDERQVQMMLLRQRELIDRLSESSEEGEKDDDDDARGQEGSLMASNVIHSAQGKRMVGTLVSNAEDRGRTAQGTTGKNLEMDISLRGTGKDTGNGDVVSAGDTTSSRKRALQTKDDEDYKSVPSFGGLAALKKKRIIKAVPEKTEKDEQDDNGLLAGLLGEYGSDTSE